MRPTVLAESPLQAAEGQFLETFRLLKERTEVMRQHVLALKQEAAKVKEMRHGMLAQSPVLRNLSETSWRALQRIGESRACCPKCEQLLEPFPPTTNVLLICTSCGFVAKSLENRRARATLTR